MKIGAPPTITTTRARDLPRPASLPAGRAPREAARPVDSRGCFCGSSGTRRPPRSAYCIPLRHVLPARRLPSPPPEPPLRRPPPPPKKASPSLPTQLHPPPPASFLLRKGDPQTRTHRKERAGDGCAPLARRRAAAEDAPGQASLSPQRPMPRRSGGGRPVWASLPAAAAPLPLSRRPPPACGFAEAPRPPLLVPFPSWHRPPGSKARPGRTAAAGPGKALGRGGQGPQRRSPALPRRYFWLNPGPNNPRRRQRSSPLVPGRCARPGGLTCADAFFRSSPGASVASPASADSERTSRAGL